MPTAQIDNQGAKRTSQHAKLYAGGAENDCWRTKTRKLGENEKDGEFDKPLGTIYSQEVRVARIHL